LTAAEHAGDKKLTLMPASNLCTTALKEFWDLDADQLLFLGEWCRRYDRREDWQDLNYAILPHPWDDREAMHRAAAYEEEIYEELLETLGEFLSQAHEERHSKQYWRIILGPWLLHYTQILHERYLCLRLALDRHPELSTIALAASSFRIPRHYWDHTWGSTWDPYNLQIYTSVLQAMGHKPQQVRDFAWSFDLDFRKKRPLWRRIFKKLGRTLAPHWAQRAPILLVDMHLNPKQVIQLMARTRFKARWCPLPESEKWANGDSSLNLHPARQDLATLDPRNNDSLRSILIKTLPHNFPLIYLEGYKSLRDWVKQTSRKSATSTVLTANSFHGNETFKFLAAELGERGAKLIAIQHGGSYGSAYHNPVELLERKAADEFWSWGWGSPEDGLRPMPSPKLSLLAAKRRLKANDNMNYIFFAGNTLPRYYYHNWSCPTGNQFVQYLNWQIRFIKALKGEVRAKLIFRPNPMHDWGWGVRLRLRDACPDLQMDDPEDDFYEELLGASLKVCDMNQTTLLESLGANIPTIAFWDPNLWELRPEAEPYFQRLREAGILYNSPEEAGDAVNCVWPEVEAWWSQREVQQARKKFAHRFALHSPHWIHDWRKYLLSSS
jgi:putative transferase (TIGR04331 family)